MLRASANSKISYGSKLKKMGNCVLEQSIRNLSALMKLNDEALKEKPELGKRMRSPFWCAIPWMWWVFLFWFDI